MVGHTVVIINEGTHRVDGTDVERRITLLAAILVVVHLVALSAQTGQGQVAHHHNSACGGVLLLFSFLQYPSQSRPSMQRCMASSWWKFSS